MSDPLGSRFIEHGLEEARALVVEVLGAGGAATLAESLIAELAGDRLWRRDRVLELLIRIPEAKALLPHFAEALYEDSRVDRRNGARSALTALATPASVICADGVVALSELVLKPKDSDVRLLAAAALGEAGNARARGALEEALRDTDVNVSSASAESLGLIGDRRAVPALLTALETSGFWTRAAAVMALGALRDARAIPAVTRVLNDPLLSSAAATSLGDIGSPESLEPLTAALSGAPETRSAALDAIAKIFAADPTLEVSEAIRLEIRRTEPQLLARFTEAGDLLAARLLGLSSTGSAVDALLAAAASEATVVEAEVGLSAMPPAARVGLLLPRVATVGAELRPMLVSLLPPLESPEAAQQVIELLAGDAELRSAASRVLGSSDPDLVWPLLLEALNRPDLRRGAAVALSHLHLSPAPFLPLLEDADSWVRAAAADGLGRSKAELQSVAGRLEVESHATVRQRLIGAIGQIGGDAAVPILFEVLKTGTPGDRFSAASALGCTESEDALDPLLAALTDPESEIRIAAIKALGELGNSRAIEAVEGHLADSCSRDTRRTAARAFDQLADKTALDRLASTLDDPDAEVRLTAVAALRRLAGPGALAALEARADTEKEAYVRNSASRAIVELREQLGATGA